MKQKKSWKYYVGLVILAELVWLWLTKQVQGNIFWVTYGGQTIRNILDFVNLGFVFFLLIQMIYSVNCASKLEKLSDKKILQKSCWNMVWRLVYLFFYGVVLAGIIRLPWFVQKKPVYGGIVTIFASLTVALIFVIPFAIFIWFYMNRFYPALGEDIDHCAMIVGMNHAKGKIVSPIIFYPTLSWGLLKTPEMNRKISVKDFVDLKLRQYQSRRTVLVPYNQVYLEYCKLKQKQITLFLIWNSKKRLSRKGCHRIIEQIEEWKQLGYKIVVIDKAYRVQKARPSKQYRSMDGEGTIYLKQNYPYYKVNLLRDVWNYLCENEILEPQKNGLIHKTKDMILYCRRMIIKNKCFDDSVKQLSEGLVGGSTQNVPYFYSLMKIDEYLIQLKSIYQINERAEENLVRLKKPSFGDFVHYLSDGELIKGDGTEQLIDSLQALDRILAKGQKSGFNRKRVTYKDLAQILVRIRNRYIGHGTMTYSISQEILYHVSVVSAYVIHQYMDTLERLKPEDAISIHGEDYLWGYLWKGQIYIFNGLLEDQVAMYVNGATGDVIFNRQNEGILDDKQVLYTCFEQQIEGESDEL